MHWFVPRLLYHHTHGLKTHESRDTIKKSPPQAQFRDFFLPTPHPALGKPQTSSHKTFHSKDSSSREHRCWNIDFWTLECFKVKASCEHLISYQVSPYQRAERGHRAGVLRHRGAVLALRREVWTQQGLYKVPFSNRQARNISRRESV